MGEGIGPTFMFSVLTLTLKVGPDTLSRNVNNISNYVPLEIQNKKKKDINLSKAKAKILAQYTNFKSRL